MRKLKKCEEERWRKEGKKKALAGFEPAISCLLDRRFNQLSHKAELGKRVDYVVIYLSHCCRPQRFVPSSVNFDELLDYFVNIQQKHAQARKADREALHDLRAKSNGAPQKK